MTSFGGSSIREGFAADVEGISTAYTCVTFPDPQGQEIEIIETSTSAAIGLVQGICNPGRPMDVITFGRALGLLGESCNEMDPLCPGTGGKLFVAEEGDYVLCRACGAGSANQIITVFVNHEGPYSTTTPPAATSDGTDIELTSGEDLTENQWGFVICNSSGAAILPTVAGDIVVGVQQTAPSTHPATITVRVLGKTQIRLSQASNTIMSRIKAMDGFGLGDVIGAEESAYSTGFLISATTESNGNYFADMILTHEGDGTY